MFVVVVHDCDLLGKLASQLRSLALKSRRCEVVLWSEGIRMKIDVSRLQQKNVMLIF